MTAAVLSIGTELTRGELINSNAAWLSAALTDLGFEVQEGMVVDDHKRRIIEALQRLAERTQVIVCTGGLGPTTDDVTTDAVATALGRRLVRDDRALEQIRRRFERFGRSMTESNAKQADFPEGAEVLANPQGTAPGFVVRIGQALAFFLPGVPREMRPMFEEEVSPRVRAFAPKNHHQVRLSTFGLTESAVGEKLNGVEAAFPGITIGYRAHLPEIEVKVLARAVSEDAARQLVQTAEAEVRRRLDDVIFGTDGETYPSVVGRLLRRAQKTLGIAESCTGGLIGTMLTRDEGASEFLVADVVAYANMAKTKFLGVSEDVIRGHGAVSPEVAAVMSEAVRHMAGCDIGISTTGIAGPGGGSDDKPVGTVYCAISTAAGTVVKHRVFQGDREQIQVLSAYAALHLVRSELLGGAA